jgi:DNA-binding NtrC family response regulator
VSVVNARIQDLNELARERGKAFRILIVDDEEWARDVFREFCDLTEAFQIDVAVDGREAISKADSETYDLITMDLIMPDMSGLEALSSIKQAAPRVPVMIITGNATEKLVREAGVMGACRVLYKPVPLDSFLDVITQTLMRNRDRGSGD